MPNSTRKQPIREHYEVNDHVLAYLDLPYPCPVRIEIDGDSVRLYVGPRDWEWTRGCPRCHSSGYGLMESPPVGIETP